MRIRWIIATRTVEERDGFRVTAPLRTLVDAAAGELSTEQLQQAADDALARGLVRRSVLEAAAQGTPAGARLAAVLAGVSKRRT